MRYTTLACLFSLATLWGAISHAAEQPIQASGAIARAMPAMAPTSAVFLSLHNTTSKTRVLVGGHSSAAKAVELHTHTMQDGMMAMRQLQQIEIPAGQTVTFQPGDLHIMLIGLNHALEDGKRIDLTLDFADGEKLELQVPVGQPTPPDMPGMDHKNHHMH